MLKKLLLGVGFLSGSVIGAGVFALPYVFYHSGWLISSFYVVVFTTIVIISHIMYAEVVEATPGEHRLVGFSRIYLGKFLELVATIVSPIGLLFMLTIYLVLGEKFILLIAPNSHSLFAFILIWLLGTMVIFWKTSQLAIAELIGTVSIAAIMFLIFGYGVRNLSGIFNMPMANWSLLFLPYGAVLFSLWGRTAIPPLVRFFRDSNQIKLINPSIILGALVPGVLYTLFIIGAINLTAPDVAESSVSGLAAALPVGAVWIIGILGLLAILTSYAVIGKNIHQTVIFDVKQKPWVGAAIVGLVPLSLYFLGFKSFISLISVVGGVFLSIEGLLIAQLWRKVKLERATWSWASAVFFWILVIIFFGGILYEIFYH
jgi:amino acid permease